LLISKAAPDLARHAWDVIVPVPLYPARQRHREFNQAQRLARCLSKATGIPLASNCLRRVLPTDTQTRLSRKERRENVKHAFGLGGTKRLDRARIVLVDDVFTTGATTNACARILKRAGAAEVCVWTLARGA
jgi:ComF family protein